MGRLDLENDMLRLEMLLKNTENNDPDPLDFRELVRLVMHVVARERAKIEGE